MTGADAPELPSDRRRVERRTDVTVSELTLPELRRMLVTTTIFTIVLALFLWMVRTVIIAAILGVVIAVYLRPVYKAIRGSRPRSAAAALLTLALLLIPVIAVLAYSYTEVIGVVGYLQDNQGEVARRIDASMREAFPVLWPATALPTIAGWVRQASDYGAGIPATVRSLIVTLSVSLTIFLFTAFYVFTEERAIVSYLREKVPPRYHALQAALEHNVRGVLYGAIYSTLLTQALKSTIILIMNLAFGVPLAAVLAVLAFLIGFFPIIGSWTVYVPVAAWLLIFRDSPTAALLMLVIGFGINTLFISMYLRPRIAAERSGVLNFYWMLVGLVTGVYTFGIAGILLGPILIGLLKAIIDTVMAARAWPRPDDGTGVETEPSPFPGVVT